MGVAKQRGNEEAEVSTPVSEDELFDVLSNQRRRYAVHVLKQEEQAAIDIGPMARQIAAWENDVELSQVDYSERKRVYTALQQQHLPRMDEAGVVEFDKDRGVVEPTAALADVDLYLDVVRGKEMPWNEYYLGLSGVAVALTAVVGADLWPFTAFSDFSWLVAVVIAFACSALAHRYYVTELELGSTEEPPELDR
ncbi:DUF7344 domain-containing protein [Haloarchaeobius amylolyticus]|uniref:DUF7344 domain-containing protein n=1 Tax=Haloarchaeobius amylolyticus TaxID=1198296 RepID=UPI002270C7C5|nr:hypothetical protein [Haloarchaeobius amylolyticus]